VIFGSADNPANDEGAITLDMNFQAARHATYDYTIAIAKVDA
jgi:hypothetical protein